MPGTVEVFTIGGGDYIVNTFNAVAAWTGSGGYKSMIQCVMVMTFAMATMVVAFDQNWRAWMNWFLQATLMYMCLMVPRVDVQVTDRINPGLRAAHVANVPVGLAYLAGFTSQAGEYLVRSAELVFGMPDDLAYSRNGMIYGSRLLEATQGLSISDPEFAANIDAQYRMCVFYDILLGRKSMDELANAEDIWAAMGPGSPARSQPFLTRQADGTVSSEIITCREAYQRLSAQWKDVTDGMITVLGKKLYPANTAALARAKLYADLPIAYDYLTGVSRDASDLMKQTLSVNAMTQAMHTMSGSSGGGSVDVYAQTRADIQTRNTYNAIAHNAMEWVPILNIVLTVVFYALFPIIFPLFLIPGTGPGALKGYATGFFYLAAWGPIYVILNMIVTLREHVTVGVGASMSLVSFNDIQAVNSNTAVLAGYLIASVPFLAAGMAKGAMAISGQATSFLAPSQNAAEEAAREASTGNVSLGNTTLDNASYNNRQGSAWNTAPNLFGGASQIASRDAYGGVQTGFEGGTSATDLHATVSNLPISASLSQSVSAETERAATEAKTRGDRLAVQARQGTASSVGQFNEFRHGVQSGSSTEAGYGVSDTANMQRTFNEVDQLANDLRSTFGLSNQASRDYAAAGYLGVQGNVSGEGGIGVEKGPLKAGAKLSGSGGGGYDWRWTDTDRKIYSQNADKIRSFTEQRSRDQKWSEGKDSFIRSAANTTNGTFANQASGLSNSISQTRSYEHESSRSYELSNSLQSRVSLKDGEGVSFTENVNNDFIEWSAREVAQHPEIYPAGHRFDPRSAPDYTNADPEIARQRRLLEKKFIQHESAEFVRTATEQLKEPSRDGITGPSFHGEAGVASQPGLGHLSGGDSAGSAPPPSSIGDKVRERRTVIGDHVSDGLQLVGQAGRNAKQDLGNLDSLAGKDADPKRVKALSNKIFEKKPNR